MSNDSDPTWQGLSPLSPLPATRRRWPWLLLFVILALACAGGVYAWPEIATWIPTLGHETSGEGTSAGDKETVPDLLAAQQKSEEDLAALGRTVTDQQDQLKTISDQLAALTSKIDALQRAIPAPAPPPVAVAPVAQAVPKARKPPVRAPGSQAPRPSAARSSAPGSSGPISTGGAPLNAAPGDGDQ